MWKVIQPQDDDRACPGIPTLNKGIGCKSFFLSMKKPQASHRILGTEAMVADRKKKKKKQKKTQPGHSSKYTLPEAFQQGWKVLN